MKQVQVVVPAGEGWRIRDELLGEFPYVSLIDGRTTDLLLFTVGVGHVQALLTALDEQGVGKKHGEISVVDMSTRIPRLPIIAVSGGRVADTELYDQIRGEGSLTIPFLAYTILAALIATFGLIADNIVAVIASMIVAPFLGPIISTSYGVIMGESKIWKEAARTEVVGLSLAVIVGFVFGLILVNPTDPTAASNFSLTGEMKLRTAVTLLDIGIAVVGGLAAGVVTTERVQNSIIGIAVAASLMPPAANVGLLFRLGLYDEMTGCFLLLLINLAAIHSTTLLVFRLRGVKPTAQWKARVARKSIRWGIVVVLLLIVVISGPIIILAWRSYEDWNATMKIRGVVYDELEDNHNIPQKDVKELSVDIDASGITVDLVIIIKDLENSEYGDPSSRAQVAEDLAGKVQDAMNKQCWVSIQWIESYTSGN
ncbi:MAG: TIGR00341 family protein [Candidatus Hodarchaeota archaeon]